MRFGPSMSSFLFEKWYIFWNSYRYLRKTDISRLDAKSEKRSNFKFYWESLSQTQHSDATARRENFLKRQHFKKWMRILISNAPSWERCIFMKNEKKYEESQKWTFWSPCFPEYSFQSIWRSDAPETIAHKAFGEHEAQGAPQTIAH